jgi:hypothetical protein
MLYERFSNRGKDNLLGVYEWAQEILPYLKSSDQTMLDLDLIRARLERMKLEIRDIILNFN